MRKALLLTACLLAACDQAGREQDFEALGSPRGDLILTTTVIAPWLPLGQHRVVVYLQVGREAARQRLASTELAYDGVPFTRQNIAMRWVADDEALVCLRASDRPDKSFHVKVEGEQATARLAPGC